MRKYLILLLALITLACNKRGDEPTAEKAYAMLERVAEQNALGNKPAALALADSALALNPADTTRCWLMSEKAVTLVDMGRMADAVGVAQGAYALARKLHDVEAMLNLRGTMGIAYRRQGMTDSALVQYKEGIDMALAEQNTEYEIYLNNCVTVLYSESNRFDEALHYARKTEKAAAAANDTVQRLSARANIGGIYMRQNNYKAALHALLPCWPEVKRVGYNVLTLKFLSVILKSYSSLADYQAVDKYMRYADRVMAGMATNSNGVLGILEVKASLLGAQHRYNEQLALIDSIMASGAQNQAMPLEKMLRMKALCLEKMDRKAEALTLMNRAFNLLDSVKQSDIEKSMSEFSVRYKTLETEKALAEQKQQTAEKPTRCCGSWWPWRCSPAWWCSCSISGALPPSVPCCTRSRATLTVWRTSANALPRSFTTVCATTSWPPNCCLPPTAVRQRLILTTCGATCGSSHMSSCRQASRT